MNNINIMIDKLLSISPDSISPVNKSEIIAFFESRCLPYRQDHVDLLSKFGGKQPLFLRNNMIDCSFDAIKYQYDLDEQYGEENDDPLPEGYCHFAVNDFDDPYCIDINNGGIYRENFEEGNPYYKELLYGNVQSFLWIMLINHSLSKISLRYSQERDLDDDSINEFIISNESTRIKDVYIPSLVFFLEKRNLTIVCIKEHGILMHELSIDL